MQRRRATRAPMPASLSTLRLLPLGGLGEIGMNCLALEQRGEALVIDCGVAFEGRELGVDVVHPDLSALEAVHVAGLFVTHGHEDHIGAIPYFLRRFDVPVFGPRYALELVRERAAEHDVLRHADLREAPPRSRLRVGSFEVEPIRVTHSIADATALAIRTDAGLVVHTGDFKFDESPPDGETFDVERFAELAREGVRLLLSDSTNVDARGSTGSEAGVGQALEEIVRSATGAVVVGIFASNVHRLRMLGEIAQRHGRKIVALGRSVETHARVARATARATGLDAGAPYLQWPSDLVWPADRVRELPRRAVLAVATGTQGETGAALARLARGDQVGLEVGAGDVVVMSSRVIPGNERDVMGVVSALLRRGVELRSWWSDRAVHVSGHAHREEQQRMIELVRPRAFVPVHGTLHHLTRHAALARELGVAEVAVLENGDVGELGPSPEEALRKAGHVPAGRVHVFAQRAVPAKVLQERSTLAARGAAHVVVAVDASGCLSGDIQVSTRGVFDEELDSQVLARARAEARAAVQELARGASGVASAEGPIAEAVRLAVRRTIERALGFKPCTLVTVVRIDR
jgi:ribonuclease J